MGTHGAKLIIKLLVRPFLAVAAAEDKETGIFCREAGRPATGKSLTKKALFSRPLFREKEEKEGCLTPP